MLFALLFLLSAAPRGTFAAPQPLARTSDSPITTTEDLLDKIDTGNATDLSSSLAETSTPTLVRYVPPLDPMKHMLMMAEANKLAAEATTTEAAMTVNSDTTTTSHTEASSTQAVSLNDKLENVTEEESMSPGTTALDSETTSISTDNSSEVDSAVLVKSAELFSGKGDNSSIVAETDVPTPSSIPDTTESLVASTSSPSVETSAPTTGVTFIESEEPGLVRSDDDPVIVEDQESDVKLTTINNVGTSGKTETTTSELAATDKAGTSLPEVTSTDKEPTTTTESSDKPENSAIKVTSTDKTETSTIEVTATETTIKAETSTNEVTLTGATNNAETSTNEVTSIDKIETSTSEQSSTDKAEISTQEVTSTPTETIPPVTKMDDVVLEEEEALEKLSSSQSESVKNISVEDSVEFRDPGLMNLSEVVYDNETSLSANESLVLSSETLESVTLSEEPADEETTTTNFGIFTSIKELLFPTTTEKPLLKSGESETETTSEEEITTEIPETESQTTVESLKVELLNLDIQTTTNQIMTSTEISITTETAETSTSDEPKIDKESLKLSEDHVRSTDLPDPTSSTAEPAEVVTKKSSTESVLIEKFLVPQDRYVSGTNTDTVAAVQFLHHHDKTSSEQCFKLVNAHWNYATNLTDENKKRQLEQTLEYALFHQEAWRNATSFAWKSFNDTLLRRWFKSLSVLGTAALPQQSLTEFNRLKAEMKNVYSTAKICPYDKRDKALQRPKDCNLTLEPDLARILTKSRDYDELAYVWKAWRDAAGKPIRDKYLRFVNLSNEAARLNGFADSGDMWRESYESESFEADLEELWEQLRPLYENLHAYVRRRLITQYGADRIREDGPIPAHLLGNMWAQSWVSLMDIAQPFPGKPSVDVTPIMEAKNLSAFEMFKISEEFFTSLGLKEMPKEFWKHSLIEKPKDREIICHASAWDFCNGKDYRIKQCTDITMEDLITVHHEMGHIQYFLQYARQPNVFREGANPGFHEAIGDVLALSVSTPKHLKSIGLLEEVSDDPEGDLNFLLFTALDKVSFLPSGYLIDLWRWGLFSGEIKPQEMNSKWWDLRLKYQGICPPVKRHETDFDPGAKFHVPGNVPYIRYFVSFVIQFQFHKVLCEAAGHTGPLYKCDIYRSKEAGQILSQVMELGSSEHWSEAMKIMTGGVTNRMDAGPILEYFQPILDFLIEQNRNETLGWRSQDSTVCP